MRSSGTFLLLKTHVVWARGKRGLCAVYGFVSNKARPVFQQVSEKTCFKFHLQVFDSASQYHGHKRKYVIVCLLFYQLLECIWLSTISNQGCSGVRTRGNGVPTPFYTSSVTWRFRVFISTSTCSAWSII